MKKIIICLGLLSFISSNKLMANASEKSLDNVGGIYLVPADVEENPKPALKIEVDLDTLDELQSFQTEEVIVRTETATTKSGLTISEDVVTIRKGNVDLIVGRVERNKIVLEKNVSASAVIEKDHYVLNLFLN